MEFCSLHLLEKSSKVEEEEEEVILFWKNLRGREEWEEEEVVVEVRELNIEKVEMKEQMNREESYLKGMKRVVLWRLHCA